MPAKGRVWSPVAFYPTRLKPRGPRCILQLAGSSRPPWTPSATIEENGMSKGMDQKKGEKKKPAKTMKEKKSEKKDKKANKAFAPN